MTSAVQFPLMFLSGHVLPDRRDAGCAQDRRPGPAAHLPRRRAAPGDGRRDAVRAAVGLLRVPRRLAGRAASGSRRGSSSGSEEAPRRLTFAGRPGREATETARRREPLRAECQGPRSIGRPRSSPATTPARNASPAPFVSTMPIDRRRPGSRSSVRRRSSASAPRSALGCTPRGRDRTPGAGP